tara:strand:- start:12 stop:122 length:111 start_codon:yes stop_codon:yes gene_type:complete
MFLGEVRHFGEEYRLVMCEVLKPFLARIKIGERNEY